MKTDENAQEIKERLKENGGYCPCTIIRNDDTKCMCKAFREGKENECHCGLFIRTEIEDN